jgi:hypothetical protein
MRARVLRAASAAALPVGRPEALRADRPEAPQVVRVVPVAALLAGQAAARATPLAAGRAPVELAVAPADRAV